VADTTPLMVAVYSEHYFGDTSLYEEAWACHRRFDGTLLMGLDLPWQADGLLRDGPAVQQAVDHLLRQRLAQAGLRFATVYGTGDARAAAAWGSISALIPASSPLKNAIEKIANKFYQISAEAQFGSEKWVACENCSDPGCEHRLFSRLMAGRCA
jgi:nicotinamide riboside kinase